MLRKNFYEKPYSDKRTSSEIFLVSFRHRNQFGRYKIKFDLFDNFVCTLDLVLTQKLHLEFFCESLEKKSNSAKKLQEDTPLVLWKHKTFCSTAGFNFSCIVAAVTTHIHSTRFNQLDLLQVNF